MKVLFLTPWYPTKSHIYGGAFVREYAKALKEYCSVVVLHTGVASQKIPGWWAVQRECDAILTDGITTYRAVYRPARVGGCSWPRYMASAVLGAVRLWQRHGPFDLIHAHEFDTGPVALLTSKWYGIPLVISEQYSAFLLRTLSPLHVRRARRVFRRADAVLPVSRALQRSIQQYGIDAAFRVVPNAVDTDLFRFSDFSPVANRAVRLLTVTSFAAHKGLSVLLQALSQADWQGRSWHLDIVGGDSGPDAVRHRQMSERLGLAAQVTFQGPVHKSEVARIMRGTDIFLLPSLVETFSVATAEALASGVPVLATRCGGPEELVDVSSGMLVPPGDARALADGLAAMIDCLDRYDRREIARSASARFGHKIVAAALDEVYSQAMSSKNTPKMVL